MFLRSIAWSFISREIIGVVQMNLLIVILVVRTRRLMEYVEWDRLNAYEYRMNRSRESASRPIR